MLRHFRPFRSSWSLLLVIAALVFTMAACDNRPTDEGTNTDPTCNYNPNTNSCT
jgi:hypothetical protein